MPHLTNLLILIIATLVGLNAPARCHGAYKHYDLIHPTFDYARALNHSGTNDAVILSTSDRLSEPVLRLDYDLFRYESEELGGTNPSGSSATTYYHPNGALSVDILTYDYQRQLIRRYLDAGNRYYNDTKTFCNENIIPRAFETYHYGATNQSFGLAFDQGNKVCLLKYDGTIKQHQLLDSIKFTYRQENFPITRYKLAAAWAYPDNSEIKLRLLDEAGFIYSFNFNPVDTQINFHFEARSSLSAINLEPDDPLFKFDRPHDRGDELVSELRKNFASEGDPINNLKLHYNHAFVEAITIVDGSLCWSTGTGSNSRLNLIRCFGPDSRPAPLPKGLLDQPQRGVSILAFEAYEHDGNKYLQLSYSTWDPNGSEMANKSRFRRQVISNSSWAGMRDASFLINPQPNDVRNSTEKKKPGKPLVPIDMVYLRECRKIAVFYPHMYSLHDPAKQIGADDVTDYKVVDWMNFPLNAMLYQNKRLFLFTSGNGLKVSKEISASDNSCGLDAIEIDGDYKQSQMLLNYDDQLRRDKRSLLSPVYDGKAYRITENATGNNVSSWQPSLNEWTAKPIPEAHSLKIDSRDYPGPTPPPGPPGPKPAPGNSTSIIIVIIIVIIIIGIVCGSVYYFCCGTPDEPIRRPKSAMRKFKTLGGRSASGQQQQQPVSGKQSLSQPAGSTLHPHDTVRSGLQSAHNSQQGSNATALTEPLSKSGQKTISGTRKTIRADEPQVSIKSVKSKRSPGPASSPRSQKTSPKPKSGTSSKKSSPAPAASSVSGKKSSTAPAASSVSGKKSSPNLSSASKKSSPGVNLSPKNSSPAGLPSASTLSRRSASSPNSSPRPSPRSPNKTPSPK